MANNNYTYNYVQVTA